MWHPKGGGWTKVKIHVWTNKRIGELVTGLTVFNIGSKLFNIMHSKVSTTWFHDAVVPAVVVAVGCCCCSCCCFEFTFLGQVNMFRVRRYIIEGRGQSLFIERCFASLYDSGPQPGLPQKSSIDTTIHWNCSIKYNAMLLCS
jgi:hypothetical protein